MMLRSRNVLGSISFLAITMFMVNYDVTMEHTNHEWTEKYPEIVHHSMGFLEGVVIPAIFVLAGVALLFTLLADRRGYVGMVLFGLLGIAWNLPAAIWRFQADANYGASICLFQVGIGVILTLFALAALQEGRTPAELPGESEARV
jgi:hypothetical protein